MLHAKALAIVTAYDVYLECAEGGVNLDWKLKNTVSFHRFREKLAFQMLQYDPRKREYPGDEKFRVSTQQNQTQRRRTTSPSRSSTWSVQSTSSGVSEGNLLETSASTRLYGFLDNLIGHQESIGKFPGHNDRVCVVCGERTVKFCGVCKKAMHSTAPEDCDTKMSCFVEWHNTGFFGLAREDCRMVRKRQRDWQHPTREERTANTHGMKQIHKAANVLHNSVGNDGDNEQMVPWYYHLGSLSVR